MNIRETQESTDLKKAMSDLANAQKKMLEEGMSIAVIAKSKIVSVASDSTVVDGEVTEIE
jgi:hypothetical protein